MQMHILIEKESLHQMKSWLVKIVLEARRRNAAVKDAQIKSSKEECALGMGQRPIPSGAAVMDVRIKLSKEECALDMGQRGMD
jgi:hypothetical protein